MKTRIPSIAPHYTVKNHAFQGISVLPGEPLPLLLLILGELVPYSSTYDCVVSPLI